MPAAAQDTVRVDVTVLDIDQRLPDASVRLGTLDVRSDTAGIATFRVVPGRYRLEVAYEGLPPEAREITVRADTSLVVMLRADFLEEDEEEHDAGELETVIVTATRSEQRIEDAPVRVEVLAREEVEEKMMMTPGDVAMMLNETAGLRVQTTSPSLGGASVRVQGLRGRYTQVLSDGLPLYGGQSGSLGLLQIPPMDLGQVEVIKGAASALYGASALGGVINLVSRRPEDDRELLLNASTLGGADGVLWLSGGLGGGWGYTFLGGAHGQTRQDVDGDRWADLPSYARGVVRPRLFWDGGEGRSLFVTVGGTVEDRNGGGDLPTGEYRREELKTRRRDAGLVGRWMTGGGTLLHLRVSGMLQRHDHTFGTLLERERDRHTTWFAEGSAARTVGAHTLVGGAAFQREGYRAFDVPGFDYAFTIPSVFAQDDWRVAEWLALTASGRVDWHDEYGTFFSPRLSALVRPAEGWTVRASAGAGYYAPTPFTEETEAIGLALLRPLAGLRAERARGASLDVGRTIGDWELNASVFGSLIDDAIQLVPLDDAAPAVALVNVPGETRTWGTEALARYHAEPWHVTATHTWTRAREPDPRTGGRREVPLTPRHQAGIVGMWEAEDRGRVGVELYFTGRQSLDDNPYRSASRPYLIFGMLAERRVGRARVFVNAENLLDVRQTRWDPLVLPARSPELRWTTDAWAPLDGRAINAGVRLEW
jgi:outer membrane receptor for ferrienterochelin and colicins